MTEGGSSLNIISSQCPATTDTSTPDTGSAHVHASESSSGLRGGSRGTAGKVYSVIWMHYQRLKVEGKDKAKCNYCNTLLGGELRKGTSHLWKHFDRCPKRKFDDMRQQVLQGNFSKDKFEVTSYSFDQDVSRKELAKMIIMHEYPLAMVEHIGFRNFVSSLNPCFKNVSRNTIKKECFNLYDIAKGAMMYSLEKVESRVALTTDMWTSSQKKGFMAVTVHYIDKNWRLQSRIIRFVYVPCPHTADVLCEELLSCLLDWNLDRKLSTITVDNCSTNDAMMISLRDKLSRLHPEDLLAGGNLIHMRCGAHILNLIVKEGLEVIEDVIERVRDSVAFWVGTQKRWEKFEDTARQLKVTIGKKLILDCKTRWNSTYLMLETALEYKDVFTRSVLRESKFTCAPDENDWNIAKEICCRLRVFYNATHVFSGTAYPTANLFFPIICEINVSLKQWNSCGIDVIEKMSSGMVKKFDKYWSEVHALMGVGVVFDPRYKTDFLECYFPAIYGESSEFEVDRIVSMCRALVKQCEEREEKEKLNDVGQTQSQGIPEAKASPVIGNTSRFKEYNSKKKRRPTRSELDAYLEDDIIPLEEPDFDVLVWWKSNKHKYPILSKIARDILAIPVSTVASESTFSTSGRVISPHRSRLLPETIEALMCAQSWLLSEPKGDFLEELALASVCEDLDIDNSTTVMFYK